MIVRKSTRSVNLGPKTVKVMAIGTVKEDTANLKLSYTAYSVRVGESLVHSGAIKGAESSWFAMYQALVTGVSWATENLDNIGRIDIVRTETDGRSLVDLFFENPLKDSVLHMELSRRFDAAKAKCSEIYFKARTAEDEEAGDELILLRAELMEEEISVHEIVRERMEFYSAHLPVVTKGTRKAVQIMDCTDNLETVVKGMMERGEMTHSLLTISVQEKMRNPDVRDFPVVRDSLLRVAQVNIGPNTIYSDGIMPILKAFVDAHGKRHYFLVGVKVFRYGRLVEILKTQVEAKNKRFCRGKKDDNEIISAGNARMLGKAVSSLVVNPTTALSGVQLVKLLSHRNRIFVTDEFGNIQSLSLNTDNIRYLDEGGAMTRLNMESLYNRCKDIVFDGLDESVRFPWPVGLQKEQFAVIEKEAVEAGEVPMFYINDKGELMSFVADIKGSEYFDKYFQNYQTVLRNRRVFHITHQENNKLLPDGTPIPVFGCYEGNIICLKTLMPLIAVKPTVVTGCKFTDPETGEVSVSASWLGKDGNLYHKEGKDTVEGAGWNETTKFTEVLDTPAYWNEFGEPIYIRNPHKNTEFCMIRDTKANGKVFFFLRKPGPSTGDKILFSKKGGVAFVIIEGVPKILKDLGVDFITTPNASKWDDGKIIADNIELDVDGVKVFGHVIEVPELYMAYWGEDRTNFSAARRPSRALLHKALRTPSICHKQFGKRIRKQTTDHCAGLNEFEHANLNIFRDAYKAEGDDVKQIALLEELEEIVVDITIPKWDPQARENVIHPFSLIARRGDLVRDGEKRKMVTSLGRSLMKASEELDRCQSLEAAIEDYEAMAQDLPYEDEEMGWQADAYSNDLKWSKLFLKTRKTQVYSDYVSSISQISGKAGPTELSDAIHNMTILGVVSKLLGIDKRTVILMDHWKLFLLEKYPEVLEHRRVSVFRSPLLNQGAMIDVNVMFWSEILPQLIKALGGMVPQAPDTDVMFVTEYIMTAMGGDFDGDTASIDFEFIGVDSSVSEHVTGLVNGKELKHVGSFNDEVDGKPVKPSVITIKYIRKLFTRQGHAAKSIGRLSSEFRKYEIQLLKQLNGRAITEVMVVEHSRRAAEVEEKSAKYKNLAAIEWVKIEDCYEGLQEAIPYDEGCFISTTHTDAQVEAFKALEEKKRKRDVFDDVEDFLYSGVIRDISTPATLIGIWIDILEADDSPLARFYLTYLG